ncbi:MAG: alpha/beta hydrolase [Cellulosilyticum sp.]|nr:alpha/beta hydrolase [Cellulosilyticum sp.]
MSRKKLILGIVGICLMGVVAVRYSNAVKKANERFAVYKAKASTIETSFGKLTYIDEGQGAPILSCHGICGGYDQAYDTLADKVNRYRVIAPSRFGYPGSDAPDNPSIEKQVEAFVELLDALNIEKTYVLATSAGGTSAIKFALMHPERTKGLILYCSGYPALEKPEKEITYMGPPESLCYDFPMWLFSPLFEPIMGMNQDTIEMIMPFKEKHEGIVIDAKITNTVMFNHPEEYDLSKLQVPVLCIHSKDDKLANYEGAIPWAERIPDCTFISLETGGHLMVGNQEVINDALDTFIR